MPRRHKNAAVAVVIIAIIVVAMLQWLSVATKPPPPLVAKPSATAPLSTLSSVSWPAQAPASVSVSSTTPLDVTNAIEICGAGRVAVDADNQLGTAKEISNLTDPKATEWLSALVNSDDDRAQAAGLILLGKVGAGPSAVQVMTPENRDTLVQLAVGAGDPAVYAMAVYACHSYGNPVTDGACPQVSLTTWAQMDATNAVPWLLLAQQDRVQGDEAAAANAFTQAAKAQKIDSYNYSLLNFADADQPKAVTPLERWSFSIQVAGVESGLAPPYSTAALKFCTDEAMKVATIRQQCNALAQLFVNASNTLIDFATGDALAKRVGWPSDRVHALDQEKAAMLESQWESGPTDNDPWGCDSIARGNAFLRERLRLGELGAAREAMLQTGEPREALAKKFEERLSKYSANSPTE